MTRFARLLTALPLLVASLAFAQTDTRLGPKAGEMAPDFTVIGPDGESIKLSDFRGKLVLIDIWATWCGPCVASMPHNSELAEKFASHDFVILAVCASDSRAAYDGWVKRNRNTYKFMTAHDPAGRTDWKNSVFNTKYNVTGFPTLFLVGRDGRLIGTASGGGPGENPQVTRLLAKGGLPIETSHLPPENVAGTQEVIPAMTKTPAMTKPIGMGMAKAAGGARTFGHFKEGDPVPNFKTIGPDGRDVHFSEFRGKPVLIVFWTGNRGPSPEVARLLATYKDQNLTVLGVNTASERADFEAWYEKSRDALTFPVAWDPAGKAFMESVSYMTFGAGMYPAYVMVDAQGKMAGGTIGMGDTIPVRLRELAERAGVSLTQEDKDAVARRQAADKAKTS